MTSGQKVDLLKQLFQQSSNQGVQSWGPTEDGYRWTCDSHATAARLAEFLLSNVELLDLDRKSFLYRYEPDNGPTLVFLPVDDEKHGV
ncbi:MAG: hypothetical protein JWN70_6149 [Planctomycetaceae bacterium]|nr:hypothetical protein [Planctomycetaceae bacterium]